MLFSDESKLRHRQQELEQSWVEVRRAAAGREQAEHNLGLIQVQLGECRVNLEEQSRELLHQQERSDRGECAWFLTSTHPGNAHFGPFWSHFHTLSFALEHHQNRNHVFKVTFILFEFKNHVKRTVVLEYVRVVFF